MWGRWYLPMFLFRDGLLTLMYKASLMAFMRFCSSLSTMLKFSIETWVTSGVIMVKYWGGGFEMFLEPLSKCSGWFTNVFIITLHPVTFISVDDSTSLFHGILVLGSHQEVFDGCTSFEIHLHPMVSVCLLETLTEPSVVWNNNVRFLGGVSSRFILIVIVLLLGWISWFYLDSDEDPWRVFASR